jgi:hypothetical protein
MGSGCEIRKHLFRIPGLKGTGSRIRNTAFDYVHLPACAWGTLSKATCNPILFLYGTGPSVGHVASGLGFGHHSASAAGTGILFCPLSTQKFFALWPWLVWRVGFRKGQIPLPELEFIDPVFTKTSPKRSFSVIQNEHISGCATTIM